MNKFLLPILPCLISVVSFADPILMIPGNLLKVGAVTTYGCKPKKWKLESYDKLELVTEKTRDKWGQEWLFRALKPGKTEIVFKRKNKKQIISVNILRSSFAPNLKPLEVYFQSNPYCE